MTSDTVVAYDFAAAASISRDLSVAYGSWLKKFTELFIERWKDFSACGIHAQSQQVTEGIYGICQAQWSKSPTLGMPMSVDSPAIPGYLYAQRMDLLRLLLIVLGGTPEPEMPDRPLTSVECSLCLLLFEQIIATLGESWPSKSPLSLSAGALDDNPSRSRLYDPKQVLVLAGFTIQTDAGSSTIRWLFPKQELENLLGVERKTDQPLDASQRIAVEVLSPIEVTVSATLGSAQLDMNQLMSMSVGDIVTLDQSVQSPIVLQVNQQPVFQAWPGRTRDKRCLQIENIIS